MDAPRTDDAAPSAPETDAAEMVRRHRAQAQEFVLQHRRRLDRLQSELAEQVAELTGQLEARRQDIQSVQAEADRQADLLAERDANVVQLEAELQRRQHEWQSACDALAAERIQLTDQLTQRQAELTTLQEQIDRGSFQVQQAQRGLAAEREDLALEREDLVRQRKRLEERRSELDRRQEAIEDLDIRTKGQRRRIAKELQEQREQLRQQSSDSQAQQRRFSEQLAALQEDNRRLQERLQVAQDQRAAADDAAQNAHDRQTQRRYELAIEEIRQQRTRISELEQSLAEAHKQPSRGVKPLADDHGMDWEAQKRRLLAALEDMDEGDSDAAQRTSINDLVRRTDSIVAERDREIAELRAHLEQQSANLGQVAVGAAAIAQMLDSDDIVRQERENLQELQREWQEKLRQAEVDLSLERAKIARERVAIEEKLLTLEKAQAQRAGEPNSAPATAESKPVRGRWLARLGLKEDDVQ